MVDVPTKKEDYSIMLKVADCDRRVQLWFPWSTPDKLAISRKKLAVFREALDRIEKGLDKLGS